MRYFDHIMQFVLCLGTLISPENRHQSVNVWDWESNLYAETFGHLIQMKTWSKFFFVLFKGSIRKWSFSHIQKMPWCLFGLNDCMKFKHLLFLAVELTRKIFKKYYICYTITSTIWNCPNTKKSVAFTAFSSQNVYLQAKCFVSIA